MCGGQRLTFRRQLSSTTWVLGIELRPLDLVASDSPHRTISRFFFVVCLFFLFLFFVSIFVVILLWLCFCLLGRIFDQGLTM